MDCQDVQKYAYTYLDGEFDARERGEVEAHLRLCPPCRRRVDWDERCRLQVQQHLGHHSPGLPVDVRARLLTRLDLEQRRKTSRTVYMPLAMAAGVSALAAMGSWLTADQGPSAEVGRSMHAVVQPNLLPSAVLRTAAVQPSRAKVAVAAPLARPNRPAPRGLGESPRSGGRGEAQALTPASAGGAVRLASATAMAASPGEVLRGNLSPEFMLGPSPFGAVRSPSALQAMVRLHAAQLPAEVTGSPQRIQHYVQARVPGIGPLPLGEGAGIDLVGARIGMLGPQAVVVYSYTAYGVPLTVISRGRIAGHVEDPEVEAEQPHAASHEGLLLDRRVGLHLLHAVSRDRVLTLVSELGAPALAQLVPVQTWL